MKTFAFIFFLLLASGIPINAQTNESDLTFAFSQLKGNGAVPFSKAIYQTDTESARNLVDHLTPLIQGSGNYLGFEIVSRHALTKRIERVVIVIYFENLPVYMRIDAYNNTKSQIFLTAKFSKDAAEILPFDLISAAGK